SRIQHFVLVSTRVRITNGPKRISPTGAESSCISARTTAETMFHPKSPPQCYGTGSSTLPRLALRMLILRTIRSPLVCSLRFRLSASLGGVLGSPDNSVHRKETKEG